MIYIFTSVKTWSSEYCQYFIAIFWQPKNLNQTKNDKITRMKSIGVVLLGWNVTWSMVRKPVTSKSPPDRSIAMFALVSVKIRKFLSGHGMAVWASILQSTADIRHLYRFAKEIHQKKAKSMVFQYSKYLVDFNKISPIPSWKKPWDTSLMNRTSSDVQNRILFKTGSQLFLCILPKPIVDYNGNIFHMNERFIM